jgi:hypothetical protein
VVPISTANTAADNALKDFDTMQSSQVQYTTKPPDAP